MHREARLQIEVSARKHATERVALSKDVVTVGRDKHCDIVVEDPTVSDIHLIIYLGAGKHWYLQDVESAAGTYLNGLKLFPFQAERWEPSVDVSIGTTKLRQACDHVNTGLKESQQSVNDTTLQTKYSPFQPEETSIVTPDNDVPPPQDKCLVVIPTYNERPNIKPLLKKVLDQGEKFDVLVVDDNSPDGTGDLVADIAANNPRVRLLRRAGKLGLGTAYIQGFHYASEQGYGYVCQMDADFSHSPSYLPVFLALAKNGYDVVIGSRNIRNGRVKNWPWLRQFISKGGSLYTQVLLGLPLRDCTSGYKCFRVDALRSLDLLSITSSGYAFQIEVNYHCYQAGLRLVEFPIVFANRIAGQSKMSTAIMAEAMLNVVRMRFTSGSQADQKTSGRTFWVDTSQKTGGQRRFTANDIKLTQSVFAHVAPILVIVATLGLLLAILIQIAQGARVITFYSLLTAGIVGVSLALVVQSVFTLIWKLHAWNDPESIDSNRSPTTFAKPRLSFTALVPARHEAEVIKDTVRSVHGIAYPEELKETLILCRRDDVVTIDRVKEVIEELQQANVRLVTFGGYPINKPFALNRGLTNAKHDVVCIFDAEDEPHPDLYNVVNTVMLRDQVDVVQSGVQLMNFRSNWYSALNVLEYFFWFKSGLHFFTRYGQVTPLGGNTVFFKRTHLKRVGGWDVNCLTEDADIGIRLTEVGARLRIIYDAKHATQEETPPSLNSFVKQRTRWNQGFLQVLLKGNWNRLPRLRQRLLALYILLTPIFQAALFVFVPIAILVALTVKLPVGWALFSFAPLGILLLQFLVDLIGLYDFARTYQLRVPLWSPLFMLVIYYPYQLVLAFSALRAVFRLVTGMQSWEKTLHINAHRIGEVQKS